MFACIKTIESVCVSDFSNDLVIGNHPNVVYFKLVICGFSATELVL